MKIFEYNKEIAKKNKTDFSVMEIIRMIIIAALLFVVIIFILLMCCNEDMNAIFFILVSIIVIVYIVYKSIKIFQKRNMDLMSVSLDEKTGAIYILKNNNANDRTWVVAATKLFGPLLSTAIAKNEYTAAAEQHTVISLLMKNEEFIKHVIENPVSKVSNGIEKNRIIKVNSLERKSNKVVIDADVFDIALNLLFKKKQITLLNVYADFEELCKKLEKCNNDYDEEELKIDEKNQKKYNKLYIQNMKQLKVLYITNIIICFICLLLYLVFSFEFLFIPILSVCFIIGLIEPVINTDLEGKKEWYDFMTNTVIIMTVYILLIFFIAFITM